jgi:hypothetical protein
LSRKSRRNDALRRELEKAVALAKRDLSGEAARLTTGLKQGQEVTGIAQNTGADYFGPGNPIGPLFPAEARGRLWDYPVGWNLATGPRQYESLSFFELRALADSWDKVRIVIDTRKDQMARLTWAIKPAPLANGDPAAPDDDPGIQQVTDFLKRPDKVRTWKTWLRTLMEDLFVLDAPTLLPRKTKGGDLYALEIMDGGTISRVIDDWGRTPLPPVPAYKQVLKGVPATYYTSDELIYRPRNQRSHKAYGYSPVEQIVSTITIGLSRDMSTIQYWTEGNTPEGLVSVPKEWTKDQIAAYQNYWDAILAGNTGQRRHTKFVPGDMKFQPIKEPEHWQKFDEWLMRVVCFAFSISPTPFVSQVNRATAQSAHDAALEEGLAPLQEFVKDIIDDDVIARFWPDKAGKLEFVWDDDREIDPAVQEAVLTGFAKSGVYTINEVRDLLGKDPMDGGDQLMAFTANGYVRIDVNADAPSAGEVHDQKSKLDEAKAKQPTVVAAPGASQPKPAKGAPAAKSAGTFRSATAKRLAKNTYWGPPRHAHAPDESGSGG